MKNWKSILLLVLVFAAGLAVGVAGTRLAVRRAVQQVLQHPERMQSLMERNLSRRLRLDSEQQVKLHSILTDAHGQMAGLRKEIQPQAATVMRGADEKISALLTPAQEARYAKFKERNWPILRPGPAEP